MTTTLLTKTIASLAVAGATLTGLAGAAHAETTTLDRGTTSTEASMVLPWIAPSRGGTAGDDVDCFDWTNEDGTQGTNCPGNRRVVLVVLE